MGYNESLRQGAMQEQQIQGQQGPQQPYYEEAGPPSPVAELDNLVEGLYYQISQYRDNLDRLVNLLAAPMPVTTGKDDAANVPHVVTIQGAMQDMLDRLMCCNKYFEVTRKRIEEQVGALKILP
jgi:hypothetical protein